MALLMILLLSKSIAHNLTWILLKTFKNPMLHRGLILALYDSSQEQLFSGNALRLYVIGVLKRKLKFELKR